MQFTLLQETMPTFFEAEKKNQKSTIWPIGYESVHQNKSREE